MKTWIVSLLASLVALVVFATPAAACDGYRRVEQKQKRYESLTLTEQQQEQIAKLKQKAISGFSDDHQHGGCDEEHAKTLSRFVAEADGVLTAAQKMELKTNEKLKKMEEEIAQLRRELAELKRMIRELKR